MAKLKSALFSLSASGTISKTLTFLRRMHQQVVEKTPDLKDRKTAAQLDWRHMFNKAVALWHALSAAEQEEWESAARPRHMTGYAWFISQALRPNPGIYLPLQGGTMQGIIDMDGYAMQALLDPVNPQDADTEAARDAAIAAAIGGSLDCDIHGYSAPNWYNLLVESAAQHNLRVRLYAGANAITSVTLGDQLTFASTGLSVLSHTFGFAGTTWYRIAMQTSDADGHIAGIQRLAVEATLTGYNGVTWDMLRSWPTGILKVGRAEIDSTTIRKTAAGAVIGGARKLYWLACSPDGPAAEWELSDDLNGLSAAVYDHFDADKHSDHLIFDPPMKFATGIYIKKFDHMHSLTFCYV